MVETIFDIIKEATENNGVFKIKSNGITLVQKYLDLNNFFECRLENSRFLEIWKWPKAIRMKRIFQKIK